MTFSWLRLGTGLLATTLLAGTVSKAAAADLTGSSVPSGWVVQFTPYAWAPFIKGDATVRGRTAAVDLSPIDVLKNLDALPWMSYLEARKGPLALYNDTFYAKVGGSGSFVKGKDFGPIAVTGALSASLAYEQLVTEFGAAYQVGKWLGSGGSSTAIDLLAGARYWRQEASVGVAVTGAINIGGLPISGGRAIASSGTVDWLDPLIGIRIRHAIAPGQEVMLRADYGGFGIGSEHSWNALAQYSFDLGIHSGIKYSGLLGYRALEVDYVQGSGSSKYEFNAVQHGPVMGLTLSF